KVVAARCGVLERFLSLGLTHVDQPTLAFDGNHFAARISGTGEQAEGEFIVASGRVTAITFHVAGRQATLVSHLEYSENPDLPAYWPSRVSQSRTDPEGLKHGGVAQFSFTRLRLARSPLSQEYFLPQRFFALPSTVDLVASNGSVYHVRQGAL